jgi:hypothetical protein
VLAIVGLADAVVAFKYGNHSIVEPLPAGLRALVLTISYRLIVADKNGGCAEEFWALPARPT